MAKENSNSTDVTEKLNFALQWMFDKGLPYYYSGTDTDKIKDMFTNETQARMSTVIHETQNENFNTLNFWITATSKSETSGEIITKIWDTTRYIVNLENKVLEYWVIKVVDRTYIGESCLFIITAANDLQASREIVLQDTQYIKSAIISEQFIQFPENNLYLLYMLEAWRYPMSFKNSDLKKYIVNFKKELPYLKKIGILERQYLKWYYKIPNEI